MKKLQPYLIVAIIYFLCVLYIFDNGIYNTKKSDRAMIILGLIFFELIAWLYEKRPEK